MKIDNKKKKKLWWFDFGKKLEITLRTLLFSLFFLRSHINQKNTEKGTTHFTNHPIFQ